jgi:hypothetical protein
MVEYALAARSAFQAQLFGPRGRECVSAACTIMAEQASIVTSLRSDSDRDRFVAFAFAAADALVELDAARKVSYAVGAIH